MKTTFLTLTFCLIALLGIAQSKPVLKLPFNSPGKISLEQLKKVKVLELIDELNKPGQIKYSFYSCVVTFVPTQGDIEEFTLNNANIEKKAIWLHMLSKLSPKSKVFIEEIKAVSDDGEVRNIGAVNFVIN